MMGRAMRRGPATLLRLAGHRLLSSSSASSAGSGAERWAAELAQLTSNDSPGRWAQWDVEASGGVAPPAGLLEAVVERAVVDFDEHLADG